MLGRIGALALGKIREVRRYRTIILILKTRNPGPDFKTAEPLLHGQRVDGGVEFATKIIA